MASQDPARNQRNWRNRRDKLMKAARRPGADPLTCWLCHTLIDAQLPYTDSWSLTWDHETSLATGGNVMGPVWPCHRRCNSGRGDGTREDKLQGQSRRW